MNKAPSIPGCRFDNRRWRELIGSNPLSKVKNTHTPNELPQFVRTVQKHPYVGNI